MYMSTHNNERLVKIVLILFLFAGVVPMAWPLEVGHGDHHHAGSPLAGTGVELPPCDAHQVAHEEGLVVSWH